MQTLIGKGGGCLQEIRGFLTLPSHLPIFFLVGRDCVTNYFAKKLSRPFALSVYPPYTWYIQNYVSYFYRLAKSEEKGSSPPPTDRIQIVSAYSKTNGTTIVENRSKMKQ